MQHAIKKINQQVVRTDKNLLEPSNIYFTHEYAELYEEKENGETQTVYFESEAGKVEYTFIKRKIPFLVDGKQYYDITTVYGYNGPSIRVSTNSEQLLTDFNRSFNQYCQENKIVSEFIRFHLFEYPDVQKYFAGEINLIGNHIARDLKQPLTKNFHKSIGSSVRKAERKGLTVSFDTTGENVEDFLSIYHQTMDRNDASNFYYFNDDFFDKLHKRFKGEFVYAHALLDGEIIASFLNVIGKRYMYGFLGGTLKEYLNYDASTFLEYQVIEWAKEKGLDYYIMGGGYSENDGIYKYKKKFDLQGDHPFYIGKRIHDENIYQKLTSIREAEGDFDSDSEFFPLYRS